MKLIEKIRENANYKKRYEELQEKFDNNFLTMQRQQKQLNEMERENDNLRRSVKINIELANEKEKRICDLEREIKNLSEQKKKSLKTL